MLGYNLFLCFFLQKHNDEEHRCLFVFSGRGNFFPFPAYMLGHAIIEWKRLMNTFYTFYCLVDPPLLVPAGYGPGISYIYLCPLY